LVLDRGCSRSKGKTHSRTIAAFKAGVHCQGLPLCLRPIVCLCSLTSIRSAALPLVSSSFGAHVILISCHLSLFSIHPQPFLCMGKKFRQRLGWSSRFSKRAPAQPNTPPPDSVPAHCCLLATPVSDVACRGPLVTSTSKATRSSSFATPVTASASASESPPSDSFPASPIPTNTHSSSPAKGTSTAVKPSRPRPPPLAPTRHLSKNRRAPSTDSLESPPSSPSSDWEEERRRILRQNISGKFGWPGKWY
jgi:hypothetical protein